jgi:uncharacterized membrane protein
MYRQRILRTFRRQFTTGLIIIVPVMVTAYLVIWLFRSLDQILGRYLAPFMGGYVYGAGFVVLILLVWLTGMLGRTYIGSRLNRLKDFLIERIPLVGSVFTSIRKVSDGVLEMNQGNFEQVVLVEYPRRGLYAIGFVTSSAAVLYPGPETDFPGGRIAHVFVPSVPNPTSGYILLVPENSLHRLLISVEEAMKLILSLGMLHPGEYRLGRFDPSAPARREREAAGRMGLEAKRVEETGRTGLSGQ